MENVVLAQMEDNEALLSRIQVCLGMLDNAHELGRNVELEYSKIEKLQSQIELLIDVLRTKQKEYSVIEHEVLFKFYPKLVRPFDKNQYHNLTSNEPVLGHSIELTEDEETNELSKAFTLITNEESFCVELFEYLVSNKFIHIDTTIRQFKGFLKLDSFQRENKIIWVDMVNGKPSNRVICMLMSNLFSFSDSKKGKFKQRGYSHINIIQKYFKNFKGDFKPKSLEVAFSMLNSELSEPKNVRQERLEDKINTLYKCYRNK